MYAGRCAKGGRLFETVVFYSLLLPIQLIQPYFSSHLLFLSIIRIIIIANATQCNSSLAFVWPSIWKDHEIGTLVSVAYVYDATNYVSSVQPGTQKLDVPDDVDGTCDVYEGIQVQVKANVSYLYESIN